MNCKLSLILCMLLSSSAFAKGSGWEAVPGDEKIKFSEWKRQSPVTAAILNLFPEFDEPTVEVNDNGVRKTKKLEMVMYLTQAKAVANVGVANIKLESLISQQALSQIDPDAIIKKISANQTMPVVVGKGPVNNFKWCNSKPKNPDIFLPTLEISQAHMARPSRPWCAPDSRTACYESCRLLEQPSAIVSVIAAYNEIKKLSGKPGRDFGMAVQSEVRYHANESEFDGKLSALTKVGTPVRGVLEINIFYVNQVLLYGKMIVVLQAHPNDSQKTVITALSAFGVREDAWNHKQGGGRVKALIGSNSSLNADSGILAGAPKFTKNAAESLAKFVQK